ncbi:MAG: alpha/beta hydrolase [Muribaculaceae bacterium]
MNKRLKIRGVDFNYTVEGSGSAVVLMHGWGCNHTTLASIENNLTKYFTVYNVDFPGFGESGEPQDIWGTEDYTELIEEWIKAEGIENPILLGHSFGGRVGIIYASRNRVKKLILVDAAGVKPKRTLKYYYKVYSFKLIKRLLPVFVGKQKALTMIDKYRAKAGSSDYNSSTQKMRSIMSRVVNEDLKDYMPKISCPTLLIWGALDTATPIGDAKIMERLIPDAGLVSFEGVGHYSFLENPYGFDAVLKSFLEKDMTNNK